MLTFDDKCEAWRSINNLTFVEICNKYKIDIREPYYIIKTKTKEYINWWTEMENLYGEI